MAIRLIEEVTRNFIKRTTPSTLAIMGAWGVGKTHAWKSYLRAAVAQEQMGLSSYAYVSLFGIGSLDELRKAIFASTVERQLAGLTPAVNNLASHTGAVVKSITRRNVPNAKYIPKFKEYSPLLEELSLLSIRESLICFDDLERKGKGLRVEDVFGLISQLRDERHCRVVLLVNDEEIKDPNEKTIFQDYLEKVIDKRLRFDPTSEESIAIAIHGSGWESELIREHVARLPIKNIRVLKRIEENCLDVIQALKGLDERTIRQAVHTVVLLTWSFLRGLKAPDLDYLRSYSTARRLIARMDGKELPGEEARISSLMNDYGFGSLDEFDLHLLSCIEIGFFDEVSTRRAAKIIDDGFKAGDKAKNFESGWNLFRRSLSDNTDAIEEAFLHAMREGAPFISAMNVSSTYQLLKDLGRDAAAEEFVNLYISGNVATPAVFDLSRSPFGDEVKSTYVRERLAEQAKIAHEAPSLSVVAKRLSRHEGYNMEDLDVAFRATEQEIGTAIREAENGRFDDVISGLCSLPARTSDPRVQDFRLRLNSVLLQVAQESKINAVRMARFGIKSPQSAEPVSPA